jgi:hypothetical protein
LRSLGLLVWLVSFLKYAMSPAQYSRSIRCQAARVGRSAAAAAELLAKATTVHLGSLQ